MDRRVRKAKAGDKESFASLICECRLSLYKVAKAMLWIEEDVEDAVQEAVLNAYLHLNDLKQERYFKTWLTRILINECKSVLANRKNEITLEWIPEKSGEDDTLKRMEFMEVLNQLEEAYRIVFVLHYVEGYKIKEMAKLLQLKEGTIKTWLFRGRKKLEKIYEMEKEGANREERLQKNIAR